MIRVIDRTLVLLEAFNLREPAFREIAELLCACGANFLEVTPAVYHQLGTVRGAQYILRIESPQEAMAYLDNADIKRFICKSVSTAPCACTRDQDQRHAGFLYRGAFPALRQGAGMRARGQRTAAAEQAVHEPAVRLRRRD